MNRLRRFLSASLCTVLLSYLVFAICIRNDLLAGGHVYSMVWVFRGTLVLAAITGIFAASLSKRIPTGGLILVAMLTVGIFSYLLPRLIFYQFTGAWRWKVIELDFELQTTLCWMAAGVSSLLIAFARRVPATLATVVLTAIAIALPAPAYRYLKQDQELVVAFVVPGEKPSQEDTPRVLSWADPRLNAAQLTPRVFQALKRAGIHGRYHLATAYHFGRGKPALQVIVVDEPVQARTNLLQPKATEIVYVRKGGTWQRIPPNAPVLERAVELSSHDEHTDFWITDARDIKIGGRVEQK